MFVDHVTVFVKGGDGGAGCCSFRREKYEPKGGPDGGDGGDGGDVIVRAVAGTDSLAQIVNRKHWRAQAGGRGGTDNCHGRRAAELVIPVPPGTLVYDRDRGNLLRDLKEAGEQVTAAYGGRGGRGNKAFATATNRALRETQPGTPGEERWIVLELKVIADAGLVGLPNAGKSTLLSRLSQAHPEIADYPFTTKHPNLGLVTIGGERAFVLADLPGLIEGAHHGIGLGHEFLRHVERTRVIVHLVEPVPADGSDPVINYLTIRRELELHGHALADKPEIVAVSKAELTGSEEVRQRLEQELGRPVLALSAVTGQGLADVVRARGRTVAGDAGRGESMTPDVVVDVGNTAIKWGRCSAGRVTEACSLPPDSMDAWQEQAHRWNMPSPLLWVVAGVHPERRDCFVRYPQLRGDRVQVLTRAVSLPLVVRLEKPDHAGIDRLLDAVAANNRRIAGRSAVVVDAGSAITVDALDTDGAFVGGAILPGLRLMAAALHEHTALLPRIEVPRQRPTMPGTSTIAAMEAGIFWAVAGGVQALIGQCAVAMGSPLQVFLTGGDGPLLQTVLPEAQLWPTMTLEGIRLSAEALP